MGPVEITAGRVGSEIAIGRRSAQRTGLHHALGAAVTLLEEEHEILAQDVPVSRPQCRVIIGFLSQAREHRLIRVY